ncbi:hypothetical protein SmJEL517_g04363 [Synchytrium microbalum]|uniref:YABBY protein C-terminal domain-containing protein n=1 Tax=Synchytrium microbalum TaxID=1806994 RepID=A0A507BZH4_9FUNG|nr:uncharacterized protein SmJEL517_g04363 [Synchytrium microbalum]TPX32531.1 hypothetical protein SmJEL517_g04363 [Synchytrium microbalum]
MNDRITHPFTIIVPKAAAATKEKKTTAKKAAAGTGGKRVSPYNQFMKTELAKVKLSHPNLNHREAFKMAAGNWKNAPENPSNSKGDE